VDAITIDPEWAALYACEATESDPPPDLVIDVRPQNARQANPYPRGPVPVVEMFADHLLDLDVLDHLAVSFPPGGARICCVCWSGMRAVRCAHFLRMLGWEASWWALSRIARAARDDEAA
jgi:hypothetical protein